MKKKTVLGVLLSLLSGVSWGLSGTAGQYLFKNCGVDSVWLTCVRLLVAGSVLTAVSAVKNRGSLVRLFCNKKDVLRLVIFAVFGLMLSQFGYLQAIRYSNAGTATAIQYLGEALILIVVCVKARRLPVLSELFGLILALTGVFLLAGHGKFTALSISPMGLLWGLFAAVALAVYTLIPGDLIPRYGNMTVTGSAMLIGGAVLSAALHPWNRFVPLDAKGLGCLALVVVAGAIVSYSAYLQSVVFIGSVKAGLIAASETVAAPLFTMLWLGTSFVLPDFIGFACIVVMVVLLALPELKQKQTEPNKKFSSEPK
ncbi:MAG TPA: EamA family transporter [Ruminococcaceae bacterium]|nr:EamA family transporter [Oscillospiraceae bacterium]